MSVTTLSDDQVATLTQRISSVENDIEQTKKGVDVAAKNELKYIEEKNQVLQDYWKRTREILVDRESHLYENLKQLRDEKTQLRQVLLLQKQKSKQSATRLQTRPNDSSKTADDVSALPLRSLLALCGSLFTSLAQKMPQLPQHYSHYSQQESQSLLDSVDKENNSEEKTNDDHYPLRHRRHR